MPALQVLTIQMGLLSVMEFLKGEWRYSEYFFRNKINTLYKRVQFLIFLICDPMYRGVSLFFQRARNIEAVMLST
jgi:hypothetical protein